MIIAIRIHGGVEISQKIEEALFRVRLRRKYSAVLIVNNRENMLLIKKLRNFIAYGTIDSKTLQLLVEKRAQLIDRKRKINAESVTNEILNQEKKGKLDLSSLGIKPFFRLHPPRGGIEAKTHFPIRKGVLGDNKEKINDLIRRML